jgi:hypothetical protein
VTPRVLYGLNAVPVQGFNNPNTLTQMHPFTAELKNKNTEKKKYKKKKRHNREQRIHYILRRFSQVLLAITLCFGDGLRPESLMLYLVPFITFLLQSKVCEGSLMLQF